MITSPLFWVKPTIPISKLCPPVQFLSYAHQSYYWVMPTSSIYELYPQPPISDLCPPAPVYHYCPRIGTGGTQACIRARPQFANKQPPRLLHCLRPSWPLESRAATLLRNQERAKHSLEPLVVFSSCSVLGRCSLPRKKIYKPNRTIAIW